MCACSVCPNCNSEMIESSTTFFVETCYQSVETDQLCCDTCPKCNTLIIRQESLPELLAAQNIANKHGISLQRARKKLNLSLKEAGHLSGISAKLFSKAEGGEKHPGIALLALFQLIEKHPELLAEVSETSNSLG